MLEDVKQMPAALADEAKGMQSGLVQEAREAKAHIGPLLSGVVEDASKLVRQELALAKAEMRQELATAKVAATGLGITGGLAGMALILLAFGFVHLLIWMFPDMPEFASYAIVAAVMAGAAGVVFFNTKGALKNLSLVPKQTLESMKENAQWLAEKI